MPMDAIADIAPRSGLAPFSLKDAPALIERVFPAQKVGIEAQKERKAGAGQTLTALGSYWKGRKPLVLVRACVLASLLPATDDPEADLQLFETLMRMDESALLLRKPKVSAKHVWSSSAVSDAQKIEHIEPPASAASAENEDEEIDEEETAAETRTGAAKWLPIDLSEFHIAEAEEMAAGQLRLSGAKASPGSKAERSAAVAAARAETKATLEAIRAGRNDKRTSIMENRADMMRRAFLSMPFSKQVFISERVEKVENLGTDWDPFYVGVIEQANARLGTVARTITELVEQLGIARFGHRPVVADPFTGGGSIPFEAARIGCDVVASDLNPVAAMLTWGALNIIGASEARRSDLAADLARIAAAVDDEVSSLGVEHNQRGDRAKVYLYCMETVDPGTGWRVPLSPSWVISRNRRCVAKMVPLHAQKRFDLEIVEGATLEEMAHAEAGTVRDGHLVYRVAIVPDGEEEEHRVAISRLRGDGDGPETVGGGRGNRLRPWGVSDVAAREPTWLAEAAPVLSGAAPGAWTGGDIWLERLYCIQWMDGEEVSAGKRRPRTFFAAPDAADMKRESEVLRIAEQNLSAWQREGLVPDMPIEAGDKTDEPIRTRGWMYWHHLFTPRHLLVMSIWRRHTRTAEDVVSFASVLDRISRLSRWAVGFPGKPGVAPSADQAQNVFYNQALNTLYGHAARSASSLLDFAQTEGSGQEIHGNAVVKTSEAKSPIGFADVWVYDPPYADAVHYHEITEYFIAWLRKNPPAPFNQWTWDSRRPLAIQGKGEKFRSDMVEAFRAMAEHMSDNGLQVCMFTHQDAGVWADMAQIVWGAGLRVTAAWYVSTETTSDLKKGGYVQGTVLLVLRKRQGDERAYKDELVLEVRGAVQRQVDLLTGLNQRAKARQRDENPFSDADVQMAGYAAALEVLTGYTHIEGVDMTREALRPRVKGQVGIVEEMIALAVQTATELMRPEGIDESLWERLVPTERFWLKMTEAESNRLAGQPAGKLDDYQNFAKAYRADGWDDLMADSTPNRARLKGAADFKRAMMTGHPFAGGLVRPVLYAVNELRMSAEKEEDHATSSERAISGLRDNLKSWAQQRQQAMVIADWLGRALMRHRPAEASAARTLAALIRTERLG